jgi:hypothetical protein
MVFTNIIVVWSLPLLFTNINVWTKSAHVNFALAESVVDICIIGAGPSGIQAAYTAEESGYTVAVFEKEDTVGGKTTTTVDPHGLRYRMGAALYGDYTPFSLETLFDKFKIDVERNPEILNLWYDHQTQNMVQYKPTQNNREILRYIMFRMALSPFIDQPNSLTTGTFANTLIRLSAAQWFKRRKITSMMDITWTAFTAFGYGLFKSIPAIYYLKYMFMDARIIVERKQTALFFQDLLRAMANSLNGAIYLNTTINSVEYAGAGDESTTTKITYFQHGQTNKVQSINCSSTVIAFPQLTKRMHNFFPSTGTIGKELKSLTDQVQTLRYATALFDNSKQKKYDKKKYTFFISTPNHDRYTDNNVLYIRLYPIQSSSIVAYSYAADPTISSEQHKDNMFQSYKQFMDDPSLIANNTIYAFYDWDYFPHVNSTSLQNGFYKKFDQLQGKANQYYTGGLFNFESVQSTMAHGEFIIKNFFPTKVE